MILLLIVAVVSYNINAFKVLTRLETFHWLQFDDVTPCEVEQTFVVCYKTFHGNHMTRLLDSSKMSLLTNKNLAS